MTALNPRCADFCTGPRDDSKGHRPTSQADIDFMRSALVSAGIGPDQKAAAVDWLYRLGYGYHAAADALGISLEDGYRLLTGQDPG